jgi:hypothetical protein
MINPETQGDKGQYLTPRHVVSMYAPDSGPKRLDGPPVRSPFILVKPAQ